MRWRSTETALRRAAEERARRVAEALQRKREAEQRLRELLRKLRVEPGQECEVPEVSREFDCVSGRLPIGKREEEAGDRSAAPASQSRAAGAASLAPAAHRRARSLRALRSTRLPEVGREHDRGWSG